jgi:uncharacterized membrane protein YkvA (DUF1232 family)
MLFRLVDQVCANISALDEETAGPEMLDQICEARPDFAKMLEQTKSTFTGGSAEKFPAGAALANKLIEEIGHHCVRLVKGIPDIANTMAKASNRRGADPRVRCALAGALAYLVQPHDLIPDNAPGGYGYIDDCLLLRVAVREYLNMIPADAKSAEQQEKFVEFLGKLIAEPLLPLVQVAAQTMSVTVQTLAALPREMAQMFAEQIIASPLQMPAPQAAPGFQPRPAPTLDRGRWSGGMYFEGNSVFVPGGPSIDSAGNFTPPPLPSSFWQ